MGSHSESFDFIIAGGGTAGCVLASRLSNALPQLSFLLIEAGLESHPSVENPVGQGDPAVHWDFKSAPQEHLGGSVVLAGMGKVLGGSSAVNYQAWTRGPQVDFDQWASRVGDPKWSWKGLLPFFKRSETFHQGDMKADPKLHGTDGPIKLSYPSDLEFNRNFPLRSFLAEAYEEVGLQRNSDINSGKVIGYSELMSSTYRGKRQWASGSYKFGPNVRVLTNTMINRLVFDGDRVDGVEVTMSDGNNEVFKARSEVIVSAGAYGSPKILMLSGVGPAAELSKHNIPMRVDLPVGENLSDHPAVIEFWKLRDRNLCVGDIDFAIKTQNLDWLAGSPCDWFVLSPSDQSALDLAKRDLDLERAKEYAAEDKAHTQHFVMYGHFDLCGTGIVPPPETSTISTFNLVVIPTARGSVTLTSSNPMDAPVIDANLLGTDVDRAAMRGVLETNRKIMTGAAAKEMGVEEFGVPDELKGKHSANYDELFKYKLRTRICTIFHPSGTCAMGKVVNNDCEVLGCKGLRVIDASVFPSPMSCNYQAVVYGLAEQMSDVILAKYT